MNDIFSMDNDYWTIEISNATDNEVKIIIRFKKGEIPEQQMRILENHIRLILMGCGRLDQNPTRR